MIDEKDNVEFDLESILLEFHDDSADPQPPEPDVQETPEEIPALPLLPADAPDASPEPLPEPEQAAIQPELAPEAVEEPLPQEVTLPDFSADIPEHTVDADSLPPETEDVSSVKEPALEGNTVRFSPITEEQIMEAMSSIREQSAQASAPEQEQVPEQTSPEPPPAEPAFEVEEEFIPSPALFTPRSRLRELKRKLVAGPEKKYYELSETGTIKLQLAILANLLVVLICIAVTAMVSLDMIPANRLKLLIFSQVLAMLVSALLGSQLIIDSVSDLFRGRFTVNTLLTLTFFVCMSDAIFCLREQRIPCCAAFSLEMTFALFARLHERNIKLSQLDTMRKAGQLHGLSRVKNYYSGKDALLRTVGEVEDFMENYEKMPAPQVAQSIYAFLAMLACIGIFFFTLTTHGISMAVQIFSTSLLVAVPASFFISISRPTIILEQRLHMVGTVLCGWQGVKGLRRKAAFPIYDQDLFPAGATKLNGVKFYGDEDPEDVISFSASLINMGGGPLVGLFEQLLNSRNGILYNVKNFQRYSGGGIGGEVHNVPVLLGSMNFLQDMGVEIPEGTTVNQAVYAAIDGQLSAVYAISYAKMRSAAAGLLSLCSSHKTIPILLCNDFMMTESFLRAKFNVKTRRIVFPDPETARTLRRVQPDPNQPCLALSTRPELIGSTYAVSGARALHTATCLGVAIHVLGGVLGIVIMLALAVLGNTDLLTPTNVLLYQLVWAIPGLLVTEWTRIL